VYRTLLVATGGLVGSVARYWMAGWVQNLNGSDFPFGTLAVNVVGSFILGLVMTLALERGLLSAEVRILLGTGFCGGFTTMSTFSYETFALAQYGSPADALSNVALTLVTCLAAVWLGGLVGRLF
jgi:fluoride exporter